jgi:hypothetical protein
MQRAWRGSRFHQSAGVSALILFFLFFVVPIADLVFLVHLSGRLGFGFTLGLVIFTGAVGFPASRHRGRRVLERLQGDLAAGRKPAPQFSTGCFCWRRALAHHSWRFYRCRRSFAAGSLAAAHVWKIAGETLCKRVHFVHYRSPRGMTPIWMESSKVSGKKKNTKMTVKGMNLPYRESERNH